MAINYFKNKIYKYKKYREKKKNNITERDFNDNCLDFIINPICDNVEKYGLLFLLLKILLLKFALKNLR